MRFQKVEYQDIDWLRVQRNRLTKYFRQNDLILKDQQEIWWKNLNQNIVKLFILWEANIPKGYVGLNPIDWRHLHAEFGIFILPEYQGKGYGVEALKFILDLGFMELNLHKIYSDYLMWDETSGKIYKDLGFSVEGVLKEHYLKEDAWKDSTIFSMLKCEYLARPKIHLRKNLCSKPS